MTGTENASINAQSYWLYLLRSGGWSRTPEIVKETGGAASSYRVSARLGEMCESGHIKKKEIDGLIHWGVTMDCKIPRGLTLSAILDAMKD